MINTSIAFSASLRLKLSAEEFIILRNFLLKSYSYIVTTDTCKTYMVLWLTYNVGKRMLVRFIKERNSLNLNIGEMAAIRYVISRGVIQFKYNSFERTVLQEVLTKIDQKLL